MVFSLLKLIDNKIRFVYKDGVASPKVPLYFKNQRLLSMEVVGEDLVIKFKKNPILGDQSLNEEVFAELHIDGKVFDASDFSIDYDKITIKSAKVSLDSVFFNLDTYKIHFKVVRI